MSKREETKKNILMKYAGDVVPPITDYQRKYMHDRFARHIMVEKAEDGSQVCHCNRCETDFKPEVPTKHKGKLICPACKTELEVVHRWRRILTETIDWMVVPKVMDPNVVMFRYVLVTTTNDRIDVNELARKIVVFGNRGGITEHCLEVDRWTGKWVYGRNNYFTQYNMYQERKIFCGNAEEYRRTWFRELNKLEVFKYVDLRKMWNFRWSIEFNLKYLSKRIGLYEKLQKTDLSTLISEDLNNIANCYYKPENAGIEYNEKETSLVKMLGITKDKFNILRNYPTCNNLRILQVIDVVNEETLKLAKETNTTVYELIDIKHTGISHTKAMRYLKKHHCTATEWLHYRRTLIELNYDMTDESYLFPGDFRKADERVTKEKTNLEIKRKAEEKIEQSNLIAKISEGLRNNKELVKLFGEGCKESGLQVYIPESAEDLLREGKMLHNCIGTYIGRVAKGQTLLFFIRRIDEPDKPYVAMEYCHGRVVQCRYNHNKAVEENSKIIYLAERIAETLRKQNILAA